VLIALDSALVGFGPFTLVGDEADRVAAADVPDLGREARPTPVRLGQQQHWMSLP
jgi:hypothetical protein